MNDTGAFITIVSLSIMLGVAVGAKLAIDDMRQEAVEHNAAHYDAKTAEFTWNNAKEKEKP